MPGGRTPGPERGGDVDTGTLCRANSPKPGFVCGGKNPVIIRDEGQQQTREIFKDSLEFKANYIDYNIMDVDYWSTAYAKKQKGYRDFWVNYRDGRRLKFNLADIPVRYRVSKTKAGKWVVYGGVGFSFKPRIYYKRGGFIYPDHFGEGSTPRLIDIATTIEFNHRQKEKFLEIAALTFKFAVILASYAGAFSSGGTPKTPRGRVRIGGVPTQPPSFSLASNKVWHYAGRDIVVVRTSRGVQAFYRRTGLGSLGSGTASKGGAQAGDWAPFDGFMAGHFSKARYTTNIQDPSLFRYGTKEFKSASDWLSRQTIGKGKDVGDAWGMIQEWLRTMGALR